MKRIIAIVLMMSLSFSFTLSVSSHPKMLDVEYDPCEKRGAC